MKLVTSYTKPWATNQQSSSVLCAATSRGVYTGSFFDHGLYHCFLANVLFSFLSSPPSMLDSGSGGSLACATLDSADLQQSITSGISLQAVARACVHMHDWEQTTRLRGADRSASKSSSLIWRPEGDGDFEAILFLALPSTPQG